MNTKAHESGPRRTRAPLRSQVEVETDGPNLTWIRFRAFRLFHRHSGFRVLGGFRGSSQSSIPNRSATVLTTDGRGFTRIEQKLGYAACSLTPRHLPSSLPARRNRNEASLTVKPRVVFRGPTRFRVFGVFSG